MALSSAEAKPWSTTLVQVEHNMSLSSGPLVWGGRIPPPPFTPLLKEEGFGRVLLNEHPSPPLGGGGVAPASVPTGGCGTATVQPQPMSPPLLEGGRRGGGVYSSTVEKNGSSDVKQKKATQNRETP